MPQNITIQRNQSVMIIEDQTVVREMLMHVIEDKLNYSVVATASTGKEGVELALQHQPDILILDIKLPDISGVEVLYRLKNSYPEIKILVFSGKIEGKIARCLVRDGVRGFVSKNENIGRLKTALEIIAQGETCFSNEFNDALITALKNPEVSVDQMAMMLTDREREVAVMIAKSFSSKEVAVALNISVKTAQNHRTNLMRKLNVHDSAGVIRFVIRQGLYDPCEGL
jgi:DNA-binding NarL/FixJ family response regulator